MDNIILSDDNKKETDKKTSFKSSKTADIMSILQKINNEKQRSIIITLPKKISWSDYEKELDSVKNYGNVMIFKVHSFPQGINNGDKCYIIHNGYVKGWMEIVGLCEQKYKCDNSGKEWCEKFIERSGPFHYLQEKIPYQGFEGFRYFDLEDYKIKHHIL